MIDSALPQAKQSSQSSALYGQPILQPGTVLGQRYMIMQLLGEGGMGAVYKAKDRELNRMVALKVIRPDLARNESIIQRFKQELILAHQVTHKNVIRIYDLGEAEGLKFITMEYIEGEDLRALIQEKKKLQPEEAVEIMQQVCRALEAAHSVGVIHRDLKPQNIMRDKTGRILVMDFGLARSLEGEGMTQTGALVGTMEYMSPEQALGEELGERSDLFTLGLIFYELLTGKMPYKAETALASLLKRTQGRATPISDHDRAIPRVLSGIVSKCLEREPERRYQTASQILADLEGWQGKRAAASLSFPSVRPWGRDVPWPLIGVITTVLVLASVGFLLRGKLFTHTTSEQASVKPAISLAILPFRNASGDASVNWLGPTLAEMVRTDMGESASLRTVSSDRVNQILHDLRIASDGNLDPDTLRRVADFTSADRVLWGQYLKFGDQIRIDATLQDLKWQRNFVLKAEASSEKDLPRAIQQLARSVQESLALSPDTIKELQAKSLKPSSQSVKALGYYSEGLHLARQGKNLEATKQFEAATTEDSGFALAYAELGRTYSVLGYGDKAQEYARKAVDLSDKVSPQEKYLILAENAQVNRDYPKAIDSYENLAKMLPDDPDVERALAILYEDFSMLDKATAYNQKLLARDPKNVDALQHMGWVELKRGNPQAGLDYLTRALTLTIQLGNDEQRAETLDALGQTYQFLNKFDDALRSLQDALAIKRKVGNKGGMALTMELMAQVQDSLGHADQALKNYQEALSLHRELGDKRALGGNLLDLGLFYENHGQYDQALSLSKEALSLLQELGDPTNESICLGNIGSIYFDKADYENAMSYFQQGLRLREQLKDPRMIADSLYNLGQTFVGLGQYNQGIDNYLRALELWRKIGDKRGLAVTSYGLGTLFEYQGRYGAALNAEQEALNTFRELKERSFTMAQIQSGYGNALSLIGRGNEGQKNLDEALAIARELKNDPLMAQIRNLQGDRLFYSGDFKAASDLYQQAMQAATRSKDRQQTVISTFNLAKVAVQQGRWQQAINSMKGLAQQADRAGLKNLSVECSVYLGEAFLNSKDYSRARQQLQDSLRDSEKLGMQALLAKSHYLLATNLRLSGNQAEASHHYTEAHRILDDIRKEAHSDDVLKRSDLATIYQESTRWSQSPKA